MLGDLSFAIRSLARRPGFALVAILTLALGIGGTTAMFSVLSSVLLRPLPYPEPQRLVRLWEKTEQFTGSVSTPNFIDWRDQSSTIELLMASQNRDVNMAGSGEPERVNGVEVTANFVPLFGAQPIVGRAFAAGEFAAGQNGVALISHGLWQRRWGGDPEIIGKPVVLNGASVTIIGVLPPGLVVPLGTGVDVFQPMVLHGERGSHSLQVFGRLKRGITVEQARADMVAIAARLAAAYPNQQEGRTIKIDTVHEMVAAPVRPALFVLMGAVVIVLLIACANVANLLLARGASRSDEIAVRTALGASRARIVRQLMTESLVLAVAAGALGALLASWGVDLLRAVARVPSVIVLKMDAGSLLFALAAALGSAVIFGLVPALRASETDLSATLRDSGRTVVGHRDRLRRGLVSVQVAMSLALLVGAGLLMRSFSRLAGVETGVDPAHVITAQLSLPPARYPDDKQIEAFYDRVLEKGAAVPGVKAIGVVNYLPFSYSNSNGTVQIEGKTFSATDPDAPVTEYQMASPGYLAAMGMRLVSGRWLADSDTSSSPKVLVINETLARTYFKGQDPIGKHITADEQYTIVGVVGDVRRFGLERPVRPEIWFSYRQGPWRSVSLAARVVGDPAAASAAMRRLVQEVDPQQAVYAVRPFESIISESLASRRVTMTLIVVFASMALLLAAIGLYGVMAYQVEQRTRELGIRMALGARAAHVARMVVADSARMALIGVVLGIGAAVGLSRTMGSLLYGVSSFDPITYVLGALLLTGVVLLASYLPARRATRIDPMVALRR